MKLKNEPIFDTAKATPKIYVFFKSGHNLQENNHHGFFCLNPCHILYVESLFKCQPLVYKKGNL